MITAAYWVSVNVLRVHTNYTYILYNTITAMLEKGVPYQAAVHTVQSAVTTYL